MSETILYNFASPVFSKNSVYYKTYDKSLINIKNKIDPKMDP